jgi:dTDP-4-dehydrorhamnose reductase
LLGNAVFRVFAEERRFSVHGTARSEAARRFFSPELGARLISVDDLERWDELVRLFDIAEPELIVNCVAAGKPAPPDPLKSIAVLSVLPHRLALLCRLRNARLVQIGSDGVFSGSRGAYTEDDPPDATDIYGTAKLLGEVEGAYAITIRTSMIGPELERKNGLLEWFLSQRERCKCYRRAIFSGLPTVVLAQVIRDVIAPRPALFGVYHVAAKPISKLELLTLVAERYGKKIEIVPDDAVVIDRSLVADRFNMATGYAPPDWPELVDRMRNYSFGLARV